jgi:orotate phosphoribosyltransferase
VQCARLTEDPTRARRAGAALAAALAERLGAAPDSVLAPALGGLRMGHEVAAARGGPGRFNGRDAGGALALRRGFALAAGARVAVVEDVVTTGRSTRETIELAEAAGARVAGVGALLDRSGALDRGGAGEGASGLPFAVPFVALARLDLPTWRPEECPRCAAGEPVEKPGSRPDVPP